jgi:hypothetical protein
MKRNAKLNRKVLVATNYLARQRAAVFPGALPTDAADFSAYSGQVAGRPAVVPRVAWRKGR